MKLQRNRSNELYVRFNKNNEFKTLHFDDRAFEWLKDRRIFINTEIAHQHINELFKMGCVYTHNSFEYKCLPRIGGRTYPNAKCPVCGLYIFYYENDYGSKVFFNVLGPPWDKHMCTFNLPVPLGDAGWKKNFNFSIGSNWERVYILNIELNNNIYQIEYLNAKNVRETVFSEDKEINAIKKNYHQALCFLYNENGIVLKLSCFCKTLMNFNVSVNCESYFQTFKSQSDKIQAVFNCRVCDRVFSSENAWSKHMLSHYMKNDYINNENKKTFKKKKKLKLGKKVGKYNKNIINKNMNLKILSNKIYVKSIKTIDGYCEVKYLLPDSDEIKTIYFSSTKVKNMIADYEQMSFFLDTQGARLKLVGYLRNFIDFNIIKKRDIAIYVVSSLQDLKNH